ncbi:hypothetical protein HAX54_033299 [Datura stramonium]|uniref:Uncharacterized protein n=1 Tax=Datura stramonium TaxID=4076 RepID=A0ABS8SD77_DATST|nr:hypothetical protein [Datura stramonium]
MWRREGIEGLPVDTSPYTQYKDLEDYKKQGYGTEGHQQPNPGRGAASSTDAPTLSGGGSASVHSQLSVLPYHQSPGYCKPCPYLPPWEVLIRDGEHIADLVGA